MYDILIIGRGPAGLSAAVYGVRAGLSVLVVARDDGQIAKADKVDNYYGFADTTSGPELQRAGIAQAKRLGVEMAEDTVTSIEWDSHYTVSGTTGSWSARALILATGMPKRRSRIPGASDLEGKGVSYCAVCDGFFYRGKTVAVIGNADFARHEILDLVPFAEKIYWLTNGREIELQEADASVPDKTVVDKREIRGIEGSDAVEGVCFQDDSLLPLEGVFIAEGTAGAADFALKLGIQMDGNAIVTDRNGATQLPGFYAAGDCTGGVLQISTAVGEGAAAGLAAARWVRHQKKEEGVSRPADTDS